MIKNNFQRIAAFLLAIIMLIGVLPTNVIAKSMNSSTNDSKLIANSDRADANSKNMVKITFDSNGGSGDMPTVEIGSGTEYKLPENGFTAPKEKEFKSWFIEGDIQKEYKENEKITINQDLTIKAIWKDKEVGFLKNLFNKITGKNDQALDISEEKASEAVGQKQPTRISEFNISWTDQSDPTLVMENGKINKDSYYQNVQAKIVFGVSGMKPINKGDLVFELPEFLQLEEGEAKRSKNQDGKVSYDKVGFIWADSPFPEAKLSNGVPILNANYGDSEFIWYYDQKKTIKIVNIKELDPTNTGYFTMQYQFNNKNIQLVKNGATTQELKAKITLLNDDMQVTKETNEKLNIKSITSMDFYIKTTSVAGFHYNNNLKDEINKFKEWDYNQFPIECKPENDKDYYYAAHKINVITSYPTQKFNLKLRNYVTEGQKIIGISQIRSRYSNGELGDTTLEWKKVDAAKDIVTTFNSIMDDDSARDNRTVYALQYYILVKIPKLEVKNNNGESKKFYNHVEAIIDRTEAGDKQIVLSDKSFFEYDTQEKKPLVPKEDNLYFYSTVDNYYDKKYESTTFDFIQNDINYRTNAHLKATMLQNTYDKDFGELTNIDAYGKKKWKFEIISDYDYLSDNYEKELSSKDYRIKKIDLNIYDTKFNFEALFSNLTYNYANKKYEYSGFKNPVDEIFTVYVRKSISDSWVRAFDVKFPFSNYGIFYSKIINVNDSISDAKGNIIGDFTQAKLVGETSKHRLNISLDLIKTLNQNSERVQSYIKKTKTKNFDYDINIRSDAALKLYNSEGIEIPLLNADHKSVDVLDPHLSDSEVPKDAFNMKRTDELDLIQYGQKILRNSAYNNIKKRGLSDERFLKYSLIASYANNQQNKYYAIKFSNNIYTAFKDILKSWGEEKASKIIKERFPYNKKLVIYNLLPKEIEDIYDLKISKLGSSYGYNIDVIANTDYKVIKNYRNSGRDLLVLNVDVKEISIKDFEKYDKNKIKSYISVNYKAIYPWDVYKDYGGNIDVFGAIETDNDITTENNYPGEYKASYGYRRNFVNVANYAPGFKDTAMEFTKIFDTYDLKELPTGDKKLKEIMTDLNPNHDLPRFLYYYNELNIQGNTASITGLTKQVSGDLSPRMDLTSKVKEGGQYQYKLRMQPVPKTSVSGLIFYDSIENYRPTNTEEDFGVKQWKGKIKSIDVSQLTDKGVDTKIYVSNQDLNFKEHRDPATDSVWRLYKDGDDLSKVQSIAIDCRKNTDGSDFVLKDSSAVVLINMEAPIDSTIKPEDKAINKVYASGTTIMDDGGLGGEIISTGYTTVSLQPAIKKVGLTAKKELVNKNSETVKELPEFTFNVKDSEGKIVAEAKNDKEGNIKFPEIEFTSADLDKTYKYTIEEVKGKDSYNYDEHKEIVEIKITKDDSYLSNNIIKTEVKYDEDGAIFKNKELTDAEMFKEKVETVITYVGKQVSINKYKEAITNLPKDIKNFTVKTLADVSKVGKTEGTVTVTFVDGSTKDIIVPVKVLSIADFINDDDNGIKLTAKEEVVEWSKEYDITDDNIEGFDEGSKPAKIEEITNPRIDTKISGKHTGKVKITFKDGSDLDMDVPVRVLPSDAEKFNPKGKDLTVMIGDKPKAADGIIEKFKLPENTKYEWKTIPDTSKPIKQKSTIILTYPDGSKDEVEITVNVVIHIGVITPVPEVKARKEIVKWGQSYDLTDNIINLPEGAKVKDVTPEGTINNKKTGNYTGKVEVTFKDGSKRIVSVPVEVLPADADKFNPEGKDLTVKVGDKPDAKDAITNKSDLPGNTNYEWKEDPDTTKPGKKPSVVVVTYPDGSTEEVKVTVNVVKDAGIIVPVPEVKARKEIVKWGQSYDLTDNIINLPEGAKVKDVTPEGTINNKKTGNYTGKVEVTFKDGSKRIVSVPVEVLPADADKFNPEGKDLTVKVGDKPDAKDAITNKGDLPGNTNYEWKEDPDTTKPGKKPSVVVVTYPDGSKEEVKVTVNVVKNAGIIVPVPEVKARKEIVKWGQSYDLTDNIINLPEGARVKDVTPEGTINNKKTGNYTGKVEVTFKDGSKRIVSVPVEVLPADADNNSVNKPKKTEVEDKNHLTPEEKAKVEEEVKKVNPKASDIEVKDNGDTTITYPDGSTNTLPQKDTVVERNKPDSEKNPVNKPKKTEVEDKNHLTPDEKTRVEEEVKIVNPKAKDVEVKDNGDVIITYPDGSTNELSQDDTVYEKEKEDIPLTPLTPAEEIEEPTPKPEEPRKERSEEPVLDVISEGDDYITGRGVPGAEVEIELPNRKFVSGRVDRRGEFEIRVNIELHEGDKVYAIQIEPGKEESNEVMERVRASKKIKKNTTSTSDIINVMNSVEEKLITSDHYSYIVGYPDNTFGPLRTITRAEVATIFARLSKDQRVTNNVTFKDVKNTDWFNKAVKIGVSQGFINGYENGLFAPDKPITRAEFASVISTYANREASKQSFFDVNGWATEAINTAYVNGWMQGDGNAFRPNDPLTRAEAVTVINRMLNRVPDRNFINSVIYGRQAKAYTDLNTNQWYFYDAYEASWGHDFMLQNGIEKWTGLNGKAFTIR